MLKGYYGVELGKVLDSGMGYAYHLYKEADDDEDAVFYQMVLGQFAKIRYDVRKPEDDPEALELGKLYFGGAWAQAESLSPLNPIVWKLAVVYAQFVRIHDLDKAVRILKSAIRGARNATGELDESVPEFKELLQLYR